MPKPVQHKDGKSPNRKLDPTVTVALITLVGTLITALFASPVLIEMLKQTSEPIPSATDTVVPASAIATAAPTQVFPAKTPTAAATATVSSPCPAEMVLVPAGVFRMGAAADDSDAQDDEKPQVPILLDAFCIDKTEVSNADYTNGSPQDRSTVIDPKWPAVNVSWHEADAYCRQHGYALPTEAQWEKAARGGQAFIYPWGDIWDDQRANFGGTKPRALRPVTDFTNGASLYGILNMAGNAAEWVADWYVPDWYERMPRENPFMSIEPADTDKTKVVRGGSFVHAKNKLRTSARNGSYTPNQSFDYVGFRCTAKPQIPQN